MCFSSFTVLRTNDLNHDQINSLQEIVKNGPFDFWKEPALGRFADIMTPKTHYKNLKVLIQVINGFILSIMHLPYLLNHPIIKKIIFYV